MFPIVEVLSRVCFRLFVEEKNGISMLAMTSTHMRLYRNRICRFIFIFYLHGWLIYLVVPLQHIAVVPSQHLV